MRSKQIEYIAIGSDDHVITFMVIESTWEFKKKEITTNEPFEWDRFWFELNIELFDFDRKNVRMITVKLIEKHSKSHSEYIFGLM